MMFLRSRRSWYLHTARCLCPMDPRARLDDRVHMLRACCKRAGDAKGLLAAVERAACGAVGPFPRYRRHCCTPKAIPPRTASLWLEAHFRLRSAACHRQPGRRPEPDVRLLRDSLAVT
jgi:hypothetical protein